MNAPSPLATYLDSADPIYGTGDDGTVTLDGTTTVLGMTPSASVYSMTRDMFFQNLTISAGVRLAPNGYRIFVKNILTLGNNSTIGYITGFSTSGSIKQGGGLLESVTHSLGGNALATYLATRPTSTEGGANWYKIPHQAIRGYAITASGGPYWLRGGAGASGQSGGGVVIIAARYIAVSSGTAYFKAPATSPAGGGVILVVSSHSVMPSGISTDVTGAVSGTVNYMQLV